MPATPNHFVPSVLDTGVVAAIATPEGGAIGNIGLIDLGGSVVCFDTGMTPAAGSAARQLALDTLGRAPGIVVNSHYHNDHVWGNQVFTEEACIISSEATRHLAMTSGAEEHRWTRENAAGRLAAARAAVEDAASEEERAALTYWLTYWEQTVRALPGLSPRVPGIGFTRSLQLHGSQLTATLLEFEGGHTPSDSVMLVTDRDVAYVGDLLFVGAQPYLAEGDPRLLLPILRCLAELPVSRFVPGHGPVGTGRDIDDLICYVEGCVAVARELLATGDADATAIAALPLPRVSRDWILPQFFAANVKAMCQLLGGPKAREE